MPEQSKNELLIKAYIELDKSRAHLLKMQAEASALHDKLVGELTAINALMAEIEPHLPEFENEAAV